MPSSYLHSAFSCIALFAVAFKGATADTADTNTAGTDAARASCAAAETEADGDPGATLAVRVTGLKDDRGQVQLVLYEDDPERYLEDGGGVAKVVVPARAGGVTLCVPVDAPGAYAFVVLHDRNANGKANIWSEGFGFSNNPGLGFSKPKLAETRFTAEEGITRMQVDITYPLAGGGS